ncbi:MAG: hypothetical protein N2035_09935 [Chthoniobacterales bacterium]|nr:hypothetical protein [Chthoniobacterales bacterium]
MKLTDLQKKSVAEWIKAGTPLGEIQNRIKSEFGISLSYLEIRLLVDDLKVPIKDPEPPKEKEKKQEIKLDKKSKKGTSSEEELDDLPPKTSGKVSVTVDKVTRPNAMISGKVTFSDGQKADWYLDPLGRLGLVPDKAGYRPPQSDFYEFQVELQRAVEKAGF